MLRHQKHHGGGSYKEYSLDNDNIKKDEYHHDNGDDDEEEGPIIFRVERVQQFASGGQNKKKKIKPTPKRTHSDFLSNQDAAAATTTTTQPSSSKALIETTTTTTVVYTPKSGEGKASCTFLLVLLANLVTVILSPKSPVHITLKGQQEQQTTTEVVKTNETAMTTITSNLWKVPLPIIAVGYSFEGDFALHQYFQCSNSGGDKVLSGIQHYCCCGSTETSYPCRTMGSCLKEQVQDKKTNNNDEATTTITEQAMNECGLKEYQVFTQLESEYTKSLMFLPQDFLLQELSQVFPNATLLLNYHEDWPQLVTNGRGVGMRYIRTFPDLTEGKNKNKMEALEAIHQQHHEHVTKFAQEHPQHQLIKLNVGSSTVGQDLQNQLGGKAECWK